MLNTKELLNNLPGSWDQLTLKQYQELTNIVISEEGEDDLTNLTIGQDNTLKVISVLTGAPVSQLEELSLMDAATLATRISFLQTQPQPGKKSSILWKKVDEITYNDYITYLTLSKEPFRNLHIIIKAFNKSNLTEEQIGDLGMVDVLVGFQKLQRYVNKYIRHTIRCTALKLVKQTAVEGVKKWLPFRQRTKK